MAKYPKPPPPPPIEAEIDWEHPMTVLLKAYWVMRPYGGRVIRDLVSGIELSLDTQHVFRRGGLWTPRTGQSERITAAVNPLGDQVPYTMYSCYQQIEGTTNRHIGCGISRGGNNNHARWIGSGVGETSYRAQIVANGNTTTMRSDYGRTGRHVAHLLLAEESTSLRHLYVNGVLGNTNTNSRAPSGMDSFTINWLNRGTNYFGDSNYQYRHGVWHRALEGDEAREIYKDPDTFLTWPGRRRSRLLLYAGVDDSMAAQMI